MKNCLLIFLLTMIMILASLLGMRLLYAQNKPSIFSLIFSPDGSKLVVNTSEDIEVYDADFHLLASLPHDDVNNPRYAFAWSPDSAKLKVNANQIYDANTLQLLQTLDSGKWGTGGWNSDGTLMFARDPDELGLVLIDPTLDRIVKHISSDDQFIESAAWSPDSQYFVTLAGKDLIVIGVQQAGIIARYDLGYFIESAAWSPDSQDVAASLIINLDNAPITYAIYVIDRATDNIALQIDGLEAEPNGIFFSPDGNQLTARIGTNIIRTWNLITEQVIDEHILATGVGSMDQSPYGGRLILEIDGTKPLTVSVPPGEDSSELFTSYLDGSIQMVVPAPSVQKLNVILQMCNLKSTSQSHLSALINTRQYQEFVSEVSGLEVAEVNPGCKADVLAVADTLIKTG